MAAMKLRAHHNVVNLDEERRRRERCAPFVMCVPPPWFCAAPDLLTAREIEAIRRRAKENSAFYQKAFAHLKPGPCTSLRENDLALIDACRRPAEAAQEAHAAASGARWRANWLLGLLGAGQALTAVLGRPGAL
jgi:hypothetical protein